MSAADRISIAAPRAPQSDAVVVPRKYCSPAGSGFDASARCRATLLLRPGALNLLCSCAEISTQPLPFLL